MMSKHDKYHIQDHDDENELDDDEDDANNDNNDDVDGHTNSTQRNILHRCEGRMPKWNLTSQVLYLSGVLLVCFNNCMEISAPSTQHISRGG